MKVRVTRLGYIGNKRRKEGEIIDLKKAPHLVSTKWMEPVDKEAIEHFEKLKPGFKKEIDARKADEKAAKEKEQSVDDAAAAAEDGDVL